MSANIPLSARYGEPVFHERSWSPTLGQVLTLLKLEMGQELPEGLVNSFVSATKPQLRESASALLASYNKCDSRMRKAINALTMQSVNLNVLHSPDEPLFQDGIETRNAILMAAVAVISLEMLKEV